MTTDITELAQRMKAAAVRAKAATEDYVAHRMSITVCLEECKEFNDLSDGPDNILALVEALEKAQAINAAAEKLVRCKGRYHSEQNYRALSALFGVKTPDLPPLEHENVHYADAAEMEIAALRQRIADLESRSVKLPKKFKTSMYGTSLYEDRDILKMLTAAGIKVEGE